MAKYEWDVFVVVDDYKTDKAFYACRYTILLCTPPTQGEEMTGEERGSAQKHTSRVGP